MDESLNLLLGFCLILIAFPLLRVFFSRPQWNIESLQKKRIPFFDSVRGVAIIAVVIIHGTTFFRYELWDTGSEPLLINAFFRFAIPLFLITSGMLLDPTDLNHGLIDFYKRKLERIFVPYLLATIAVVVATEPWSWTSFGLHVLRGDALPPYYFVVVLFLLYALYPLFIALARHAWFLPVLFGISLLTTFGDPYTLWDIPLPLEYFFYFAYGIAARPLLYTKQHTHDLIPWIAIMIAYFIFFAVAPGYYFNGVLFWGTAVFVVLFSYRNYIETSRIRILLEPIGKVSVWIFLIHYPILYYLGDMQSEFLLAMNTSLGIVLISLETLIISTLLSLGIAHLYGFTHSLFYRVMARPLSTRP